MASENTQYHPTATQPKSPPIDTYRKVFFIICIIMLIVLAILIVFTIYKCRLNCNNHNTNSFSCIFSGSLYCCQDETTAFFPPDCQKMCQFDNSQCSDWIIGSCFAGALLLLSIGVTGASYSCPRRIWPSAYRKTEERRITASDVWNKFFGEKTTSNDATESLRSSTFDPKSIN